MNFPRMREKFSVHFIVLSDDLTVSIFIKDIVIKFIISFFLNIYANDVSKVNEWKFFR